MSQDIQEPVVVSPTRKALTSSPRRVSTAFAMRPELPAELFDADALGRLSSCLDVLASEPITDLSAAAPTCSRNSRC